MKISKKVREDAALILAVVASNRDSMMGLASTIATAAEWLGIGRDEQAAVLARSAFHDESVTSDRDTAAQIYADAESLLRTGWSPRNEA